MRICRIGNFPRDNMPGMGLPAYFPAKYIVAPTLYITKHFQGTPREVEPHVKLQQIKYPDKRYNDVKSSLEKLQSIIVKGIGYVIFFILCVPHMCGFKPNVLHIHGPHPILQGIFARMFLKSKVVVSFHGSDVLLARKFFLIKWLMRFADKIVVVSKRMISDLQGIIPEEKIVHISSGVDVERFRDLGLKRENMILAIGNLRWQKGYPYLIDAMSEISQKFPHFKLWIVGDGPLKQKIKEQIESRGLTASIDLLGTKSREEIVHLLNKAKILVLSSVSEGFPKVLVEAIACGTPIVVTNVGDCPDAAEGVGIVVNKEDSGELACAIEKLLENERLWNEYHLACGDKFVNYDWRKTADKLKTLYSTLLEQKAI